MMNSICIAPFCFTCLWLHEISCVTFYINNENVTYVCENGWVNTPIGSLVSKSQDTW